MSYFRCGLALAACIATLNSAEARPCRRVASQALTAPLSSSHEAVFAVPVAAIVVAVQPAFYYSYRAAAPATLPTANRGPSSDPPLAVPTAALVLREHCFRCHSGATPRGGLSFFADDGDLLQLLPRRAILEMASPSADSPAQMPPGEAQKLSDGELELLRAWAEPPRDLKY